MNIWAERFNFRAFAIVLVALLVACGVPVTPSPAPIPSVPAALPTVSPTPEPTATLLVPATATSPLVIATSVRPVVPTPTPRPAEFGDVDTRSLLGAILPDLKLSPSGDEFLVNDNSDWIVWINSRAEGRFTQDATAELAVIVSHEAPHLPEDAKQRIAPWGSFLAILQKGWGKLQVAQRSYLFPADISPLAFNIQIERVTDFDRDGVNELLITTNSKRLGITSTAAFLYQWNDQVFVEIWSAPIGEDNTAAVNQAQYYTYSSEIELSDINADGLDEIVVTATRVDYPQDVQGLADIDHESGRTSERRIYTWGGTAFVLDQPSTTPKRP